MKKIKLCCILALHAMCCTLFMGGLSAQDCIKTFGSTKLNISICNDEGWKIEQSSLWLKIKMPDVATFVTIYAEPYSGNETSKELADQSFQSDVKTYPSMVKLKEEDMLLDSVAGTFYIAQKPDKSVQTCTFILIHDGRKYTINNNCYSNCGQAETAVKKVIERTRFIKIVPPVLTEKQLTDFKIFGTELHAAFQSGKSKSFEKLLITRELMLELIETNVKDEEEKNNFTNTINNNWAEFSKEFIDQSKASFEKRIAEGKQLGIKWKKIEFIDMRYSFAKDRSDFFSAKCEYRFSFQGKAYEIVIDNVEILSSGWFISRMTNASGIIEL